MATKEEISIIASQGHEKYDEVVKENMHFPKLIAPILKAVVPEYKEYSIDDVVEFIIKDSITDDAVDEVSVIAGQMDTEMSSVSEKLIRYDSRFKALNPKLSDQRMSFYLHIDLEVQNDYKPSNPKYPIIKRALYYGAREISSQLGILTDKTNYNSLEKVYSIWICNENIPSELQNTVTSYSISKTDEIGVSNEPVADYDLLNVIMIRRGKETSSEAIFDYLTAFFSSNIEGICKYVNIKDDAEVMEGVRKMSGLGETISKQNYEQGGLDMLISLVKEGLLNLREASRKANMTEADFSQLMNSEKKR